MRFLIVGLGSIGRRHVSNLKRIDPTAQIAVWSRTSQPQGLSDVEPLVNQVVTSLEDALATGPEAVLITNPASLHVEAALPFAEKGIHLFIEKPLATSLEDADELLDLCKATGSKLMVGYNLRFYKPLQVMRHALCEGKIGRVVSLRAEVGQYLPEWRPNVDYRQSVSARRELGGGAVFELSHELDYAGWLAGEVASVTARVGHLSDLEIDAEDTAEIVFTFRSGAIGSVHLDMVRRPAARSCTIIGTEGTLSGDWLQHRVSHFSNETGRCTELIHSPNIDRNDSYLAELDHFVQCVTGNDLPATGGDDARKALEIALAAKRSSLENSVVNLDGPVARQAAG